MYVQGALTDVVEDCLRFMSTTLFVQTSLDECWALDRHTVATGQSPTAELVFRAKTYGSPPGDPAVARELASSMAELARLHPVLAACDLVVGVPANPPKARHNLPEVIAGEVARTLGIPHQPTAVVKRRPSAELKNLDNAEKVAALNGVFGCDQRLDGRRVLLIDDVLRSGTTLDTIAGELRRAGAVAVVGFVATKTLRD